MLARAVDTITQNIMEKATRQKAVRDMTATRDPPRENRRVSSNLR